MTIDPNRIKASFPMINRFYTRNRDTKDIVQIVSELGASGLPVISVTKYLQSEIGENAELDALFIDLTTYYKVTEVLEIYASI